MLLMAARSQAPSPKIVSSWIGCGLASRSGTPNLRSFLMGLTLSLLVLSQFAEAQQVEQASVTLELEDGKELTGVLVKETAAEVFLDLGYTIIAVPKGVVASRKRNIAAASEEKSDGAAETESDEAIYKVGRLDPVTVREAVKRFGQGVVQIRFAGKSGSGFVIDKRGYVVTNFHVVENERDIEVTLFIDGDDGVQKESVKDIEIVALNPYLDLALIRIPDAERYPLKPLTFADSSSLKVGEPVFAIGAPMGLERTVSEGIVSDANRSFGGNVYVQTTAPINPGNSGGALFNSRGEVVGCTNMKIMGGEGLNFAIPMSQITFFVDNRSAFLFDEGQPNTGIHYFDPPRKVSPND